MQNLSASVRLSRRRAGASRTRKSRPDTGIPGQQEPRYRLVLANCFETLEEKMFAFILSGQYRIIKRS